MAIWRDRESCDRLSCLRIAIGGKFTRGASGFTVTARAAETNQAPVKGLHRSQMSHGEEEAERQLSIDFAGFLVLAMLTNAIFFRIGRERLRRYAVWVPVTQAQFRLVVSQPMIDE